MSIRIIECEQGSPQWHAERAGATTASMFAEVRRRVGGLNDQQRVYVDVIRAGGSEADARTAADYRAAPKADVIRRALAGEPVGDFTDAAKAYAFRLAVERLSGEPLADEQFETFSMRRGHELEPDARRLHAFEYDLTIRRTGIVLTSDGKFGASADGLIGEDGGSEYKCFIDPARIRSIVLDRNIDEYRDQVQGCLWLTGRRWWHFCLYCPALGALGHALTVFHIDRDDEYIAALESDLLAFDALVCEYQTKLLARAA